MAEEMKQDKKIEGKQEEQAKEVKETAEAKKEEKELGQEMKQDKTEVKEQNLKVQKEKSKKKGSEIKPKDYAVVNAQNLKISTKDSISICKMIRGKKIEQAIEMLEEVLVKKRVVKMENREVGHKHGKGIAGGRYPIKSSAEFIRLLKQLNANAIANMFDVDEGVLSCKADVASRRYRRMGHKFKATHLSLRIEKPKQKKNKKKKVQKKQGGKKQ
jgi:ribosomal protein L22